MKTSYLIVILFLLALIGETTSAKIEPTKYTDRISNSGQNKGEGIDHSIPDASPSELDDVNESVLPSINPNPRIPTSELPSPRPGKPSFEKNPFLPDSNDDGNVQDIILGIHPSPVNPCGPPKRKYEKAKQDRDLYQNLFSRAVKELSEARKVLSRAMRTLQERRETKNEADENVSRIESSLRAAQAIGDTSLVRYLRMRLRQAQRALNMAKKKVEQAEMQLERAETNERRKAQRESSAEDALEMSKDKLVVERRTYLRCKHRLR